MANASTDTRHLDELKWASARLGRDRSQIQAGGGNTSWKEGDRLFIKASGKCLADALGEDIFVQVSLRELRTLLAKPAEADDERFVPAAADIFGNPTRLRPSIETAFHAALDAPVVLHTHSTSVIAHSILTNGNGLLARLLGGLPWSWIPYMKPGIRLAREVAAAGRGGDVRIFVLANHGVIVTGSSVAEAEALLEAVENRLLCPPSAPTNVSAAAAARLEAIAAAQAGNYEMAAEPAWHALGLNPRAFALATGGSLYPDHVIFLGPAAWYIPQRAAANTPPWNISPVAIGKSPSAIVVEAAGCLVRKNLGPAPSALLACLVEVAAKRPVDESVNYLSTADEAALLNWDAEHYRQKLAAGK